MLSRVKSKHRETPISPLDELEAASPQTAFRPAFPFKATVDLAEMDERGRPSVCWNGRTREISRSHVVLLSRRMCYEGRHLLIAIHLIDDRPVPLYGRVSKSDYDGEGLYVTTVLLEPLPQADPIQAWLAHLHPRV